MTAHGGYDVLSGADDRPFGARLVLENGAVFHGRSFGGASASGGEVVFNTSMSGYQEALTDPSYTGQILVMTAPEIGNYGVTTEDVESDRIAVSGFVVRQYSRIRSNHRAQTHLHDYLLAAGVPGIEGVDTRAIVRILRSEGAMRGVIEPDPTRSDAEILETLRQVPSMQGCNLAGEVGAREAGVFTEGLGAWRALSPGVSGDGLRVIAIDCGAKRNIYRNLVDRGCVVDWVPFDIPAADLEAAFQKGDVHGLFISNGPGDPAAVEATIETLKAVAGTIPTFGICLGHQLLAHSIGAETFKLKFGHRGANQPVRNELTGQVEITSQNHGFGVSPDAINDNRDKVDVTHVNLNDETIEG
ncbi:MAG: glutamine-hydrolyzing carbamoyl-phosphate synthase small subunit, partial [Phycisphaera sp.]|nr:glutamine-hydrolyzing carbamoyl-phosphate synthase small subunit [Phycisphaera sp.]